MSEPIGQLEVMALDCPDPHELGAFYRSIIGGEMHTHSHGGWVEIRTVHGNVAFQQIDDFRAPTWPNGNVPQQAHLDVRVDDLDDGEAAVLELGAVKAGTQPSPDNFRVFLDPVGHPFCLVRPWQDEPGV